MKLVRILLMIAGATVCLAQGQINKFAAVGASVGGVPPVAVTGLFAQQIANSNSWGFTVVDAVPTSFKPVSVVTNTAVGIAQKVATVGKVDIFIPTAAGVSWTGQSTGWNWSTGAMGVIALKNQWKLTPAIRLLKSSVNSNSGYQVIGSVMIGWGW